MVKKFVKLYLHSSCTVQISFCFDENPGKNISDEVLKLKMNAISTVVILGRKFKYFRGTIFFYLNNENETFLMILKYCGFDTMTT